ncbi:hypothetical protein HMPREF0765_4858 [Sphingobacterium spiritivorum ATCC 33300]|uniref:Uncharacterized protein n=1 Tax=Sphingobacterium spiritivorum ATCC 33300 TaxID=525372 RepID=C2G5K2_SPHSI|nr:hypothetical protein HMPREF0765_4858 [Sphingobacterium spiritivorum ATCC 33300]
MEADVMEIVVFILVTFWHFCYFMNKPSLQKNAADKVRIKYKIQIGCLFLKSLFLFGKLVFKQLFLEMLF